MTMPADFRAFHESLAAEFLATRDRVRSLIGGHHWPSDGNWKEAILRRTLSGLIPGSFEACTGFAVSGTHQTGQIDVLILDRSAPVLFRDGDFVIVSPEAVAGVIEVKTTLTKATLADACAAVGKSMSIIRPARGRPPRPTWGGIFAFERGKDLEDDSLLDALRSDASGDEARVIDGLAVSNSWVRHWRAYEPNEPRGTHVDYWAEYDLGDLATSYFISNVVDGLYGFSDEEAPSWYTAPMGKEAHLVRTRDLNGEHV